MFEFFGTVIFCLFVAIAAFCRGCYVVARMFFPDPNARQGCGRFASSGFFGCVWFLIAAVAILFVLPIMSPSHAAARRSQCTNNLKQIVLAMHNYHDEYKCFPPAYTVDKAGRPLHSWRTLLLPYLEQKELYKQLRLDEPWDSKHNQGVFALLQIPAVFRCPSDPLLPDADSRSETNYVAIVGPRTVFPGPKSVRLKDITDDPAKTIAVVETYDLGIRWYEPRDLKAEEMSFRINDPDLVGIASRHPGGANVGFADGRSVSFLPDTTEPRIVEAMTTINGKEKLLPGDVP